MLVESNLARTERVGAHKALGLGVFFTPRHSIGFTKPASMRGAPFSMQFDYASV